jgi:hypothetical protein
MRLVFIADAFVQDGILGGGELNNEELINILASEEHDIVKARSDLVNLDFIKKELTEHKSKFIIANFMNLELECIHHLQENAAHAWSECDYIIYEHDHKYLKGRNPAVFENFKAPKEYVVFEKFYKNALAVLCQSQFHVDIITKNLDIGNVVNLSGNLWSEKSLNILEELSKKEKNNSCSIMDSGIPHKNTADAIKYCKYKNYDYTLVSSNDYYDFLSKLGKNKKFVFFPKTPETLSRVAIEARMMGMEVITNNLLGATKEEWYQKKGQELIDLMRKKRNDIPSIVKSIFNILSYTEEI